MRSPLHALCLHVEEVVNPCFLAEYAVIAQGDIDFTFPPLGCAHSIPGKNSEAVPLSHRRQTLDVSSLAFLLSSFPKGLRPENPEIIDEHIPLWENSGLFGSFQSNVSRPPARYF